jgi:hypothetical protein
MALLDNINDREKNKFRDAGGTLSKVAVTLEEGILAGIQYDEVQATYPTSVKEQYAYYLSSSLVATIEVEYTTSSKLYLLSVKRI